MGRSRWHLLSNHGAVLIYLAARPDATIREAASATGMSHRRTAGIVRELVDAGMLVIVKCGMRNHYRVVDTARFPHRFLSHLPVSLMLTPVVEALTAGTAPRTDRGSGVDGTDAGPQAAGPTTDPTA